MKIQSICFVGCLVVGSLLLGCSPAPKYHIGDTRKTVLALQGTPSEIERGSKEVWLYVGEGNSRYQRHLLTITFSTMGTVELVSNFDYPNCLYELRTEDLK